MSRSALLLVSLGTLLASLPGAAHAYPVHRRLFQQATGQPAGCQLCHDHGGGTRRNVYGEAWHEAGESLESFTSISAADADADGFSNGAEIEGRSNPGDPGSTPEAPGDHYRRDLEEVFIPLEQLELVFPRIAAVEAAEVELTDAMAARVAEGIGVGLELEDRLPTLYFNVRRGERQAVALFTQAQAPSGVFSLLVGVSRDGTTSKVIIFRSPDEEGHLFHPYLRCLRGVARDAIPEIPEGECMGVEGRVGDHRALGVAVQKALYTVAVYLEEAAAQEPAELDAGAQETDAPPTAPASGELDFSAAETTTTASLMPTSIATVLTLVLVALFLALVYATGRWAAKRPGSGSWPSIDRFPGAARLLVGLVTLGLSVTQLVAIAAAYVQTQQAHESVWTYFQHLSEARLLGTSHAHLFGYTMLYGTLGLLLSFTSCKRDMQAMLVAAMLWAGPFDVLSWWALKLHSPRFEWLTSLCGMVAGTAALVAAALILKAAFVDEPAPVASAPDTSSDGSPG